jgi:hypothetical protein
MAQKWEYNTIKVYIIRKGLKGGSDPSMVWTEKDKEGKTTWDSIKDLGKNGYELVSVTPITDRGIQSSHTTFLVYTFKRPIEEEKGQVR